MGKIKEQEYINNNCIEVDKHFLKRIKILINAAIIISLISLTITFINLQSKNNKIKALELTATEQAETIEELRDKVIFYQHNYEDIGFKE